MENLDPVSILPYPCLPGSLLGVRNIPLPSPVPQCREHLLPCEDHEVSKSLPWAFPVPHAVPGASHRLAPRILKKTL